MEVRVAASSSKDAHQRVHREHREEHRQEVLVVERGHARAAERDDERSRGGGHRLEGERAAEQRVRGDEVEREHGEHPRLERAVRLEAGEAPRRVERQHAEHELGEGRHVLLGPEERRAPQRRAAEHQQLVVGEIKHRIKNSLATVQAIARQTLTSVPSEQMTAFVGRLQHSRERMTP